MRQRGRLLQRLRLRLRLLLLLWLLLLLGAGGRSLQERLCVCALTDITCHCMPRTWLYRHQVLAKSRNLLTWCCAIMIFVSSQPYLWGGACTQAALCLQRCAVGLVLEGRECSFQRLLGAQRWQSTC